MWLSQNKILNRGSALITALLIVMFTSGLLVSLIWRQNISIKRTHQMIDAMQAYQHALGVEVWAIGYLKDRLNPKNPLLTASNFPIQFTGVAIPGGSISGSLEDYQAKFNVNLFQNTNIQSRLITLIQKLDPSIDQKQLSELINSIRTSLINQVDTEAKQRQIIYKMASPSELRGFPNFSAKLYSALSPYIVALPKGISLNINTLPPLLLYAIVPKMNDEMIKEFVLKREKEGFKTTNDFWQFVKNLQTANTPDNEDGSNDDSANNVIPLDTTSQYFLAKADIQLGRTHLVLFSLLQVDPKVQGSAKVIWRSRGSL